MRIALVHDYLTQFVGAEPILKVFHRRYPTAPVFASLVDLTGLSTSFASWIIHPSPLQRLPEIAGCHWTLLPVFPVAFRKSDRALRDFDLVIAGPSVRAYGIVV